MHTAGFDYLVTIFSSRNSLNLIDQLTENSIEILVIGNWYLITSRLNQTQGKR